MDDAKRAQRARKRLARPTGRAFWIRSIAVAIFDALALLALGPIISEKAWIVLGFLIVTAILVNWAYLNPRAVASRWLTPGLVLMALFVVFPVLYTTYISFTNWQTGNVLTKDQVIERLEDRTVRTDAVAEVGDLLVYRNAAGDLALLVAGETIEPFIGIPRPRGDVAEAIPVEPFDPAAFDPDDPPAEVGGFELLPRLAVTGEANRLETIEMDLPDGRAIAIETLSSVRIVAGGQRFVYDPATDTIEDRQEGRTCASGEGAFYCDDVPRSDVSTVAVNAEDSPIRCADDVCDNVPLFAIDGSLPGWRQIVGGDNYADLAQNERIRAPFLRVLVWNVAFAALTVLSTFALGLGLAIVVQNEAMKGRNVYRSIFIIPYAIPAFLSILVWRGLLSTEFGQVNEFLNMFGIPDVDWLGKENQARAAVLLVNLWLGFPYMFLISSGALTSIPEELLEAARVDGAGPWRSFRMITLPLLLVSTAPLLIGSFAFNFNNFVLIFLLTNGGPPLSGYDVPVGSTDLLISFTFDLAQASGRGQQFGLSSAIVVVIFLVLATTSALSFRLTKRLEDIYDQ